MNPIDLQSHYTLNQMRGGWFARCRLCDYATRLCGSRDAAVIAVEAHLINAHQAAAADAPVEIVTTGGLL